MSLVNRYLNNSLKYNSTGRTVYRSIIYPTIPKSINDIYIITTLEDRLDLLAHKYYNDVRLWWIIAQANNIGKGTFYIEPGSRIRIPKELETIQNEFEKLNVNR